MNISLILATSRNRVIGIGDKLPWKLPVDMAWFKKNTMGKMVVQGRKTFDSIGSPLPGRENVILTRDKNFSYPMVTICRTFEAVMSLIETHQVSNPEAEVMIIGGAEIYSLFEPVANKIYMTSVDVDIHDKDAVLAPPFDTEPWEMVYEEAWVRDKKNPYSGTFYIFERK